MPGLRERKKIATSEAIETAARALFLSKGYAETTVDDIAEAAGVSPRTFFRYFAAKEDVVFTDTEARIEHLLATLDGRPSDERPLESLRQTIVELALDYEDHAEPITFQAKLLETRPELQARAMRLEREFIDALAGRLATRLQRSADDIEVQLAASVLMAVMRVAVAHWTTGPGSTPLHDIVDRCLTVLDRGLDL